MHVYGELIGKLKSSGQLSGFLNAQKGISGLLTIPSAADVTVYDGPYEFTPTEDTQTVAIERKMATENIVINPIPYNYGLVTWNGSTLTVS